MPKSILKKYPVVDRAVSTPISNSQEEHNRETALYHANLLQQRKDVEAVVLTSTETPRFPFHARLKPCETVE